MRKIFILHNFFVQILEHFKNYLKNRKDIKKYNIFRIIPHRRVTSKNTYNKEEIFDLYQLGTFSTSQEDSSINIHQENLELVELQAQTEYERHYHKNSTAIIYIISGSGEFLLDEKQIQYNGHKRIVIPEGVMHGFRTSTQTFFLSIQTPPIIDPQSNYIDIHYEKELKNEEN